MCPCTFCFCCSNAVRWLRWKWRYDPLLICLFGFPTGDALRIKHAVESLFLSFLHMCSEFYAVTLVVPVCSRTGLFVSVTIGYVSEDGKFWTRSVCWDRHYFGMLVAIYWLVHVDLSSSFAKVEVKGQTSRLRLRMHVRNWLFYEGTPQRDVF